MKSILKIKKTHKALVIVTEASEQLVGRVK